MKLLEEIQVMLKTHISECYDLRPTTQYFDSRDNETNQFFHQEIQNVAEKEVAIHIKGFEEKIPPEQFTQYRSAIRLQKYGNVEYLQFQKIEQDKLVRLD